MSEKNKEIKSDSYVILRKVQEMWLEGDWQGVIDKEKEICKVGNKKAKSEMICFLISAYLQKKDTVNAENALKRAKEYGVDSKELFDLLGGDVDNTLGRIYALHGDTKKASEYFRLSVTTSKVGHPPEADKIRAAKELSRLGLVDEAIDITDKMLGSVSFNQRNTQMAIQRVQAEIRAFQKKKKVGYAEDNTNYHRVFQVVQRCFEAPDVHKAIDEQLLEKARSYEENYHLCVAIAERMNVHDDRLQALSWINQARLFLTTNNVEGAAQKYQELAEMAVRFGQSDLAIDLSVESNNLSESLSEAQKEKLKSVYENMRGDSEKRQQHGHDLLIEYLKAKSSENKKNQPVLIEVGTTRENVPGQGSTLQLAALAKQKNIQFISVDMDPHNSCWATFNLELMRLPGTAVTQKGEDFLAEFSEEIEYVFLDAYDFDHGKHSELRQQRYQKYLGGSIDERQCHQMHLECAKALLEKLSQGGLICIDDTWQDEKGKWKAKGTLAVPYLLENGFKIIEARNRAVLMKRENDA